MSESLPTATEAVIRNAGWVRNNPTKLGEAMVRGISVLNSMTLILEDERFEVLASEMREIMTKRLFLASDGELKQLKEDWGSPILTNKCCSILS
ncbi:MAG: hypothetical protein QM493_10405 [Sulfurovum sp.]